MFTIQDELGPKILQILPAKVSEAELRRVAQRYTRNLEAFEYFQRGQSALLVRQKTENETARDMFRRAIALDAAFARAYAGLALTYAADYRNQWTADGPAALDRALEMAQTAHQINPDIRETYWVLAFVHMERRQHEQALQYLRTAVRLYPSFADGYALMGGIDTYIGRPADTVPLLRTAMRLDPEAGDLYFLLLGRAYLFLGDLEQARVNLAASAGAQPGQPRDACLHGGAARARRRQSRCGMGSGGDPDAAPGLFQPRLAGNLSDDRRCAADQARRSAGPTRLLTSA